MVVVPCHVDCNGVRPIAIDAVPLRLASIMGLSNHAQREVVKVAVTGKRENIYHAAMLDPHTAGELNLDQIWSLVDDLNDAHEGFLPKYD